MNSLWTNLYGQIGGSYGGGEFGSAQYFTQSIPQSPMERLKQKKEFIINTITENQKELELVEQAIVALEASPITETILNFLVKLRIL